MRYFLILGVFIAIISTWNQQQDRKKENKKRLETIAAQLDKYENMGTPTVASSVPLVKK